MADQIKESVRRPFLRWVGSKRKLISQILPFVPKEFGTYFEPFLGSGSLFFYLAPKTAVLSDANAELISTFQAVRDAPCQIISYLEGKKPDRNLYYDIRAKRSRGRIKRASEFIYLNKTCWNALYRVNLKGVFNVPYGAPKTNSIFDSRVIRDCAKALKSPTVSLMCADFELACATAKRGDFVFLDPPYVTMHNNNGFIEYNEEIFSWNDQIRLAKLSERLVRAGVTVIVTNANHKPLISLFDGFSVTEIARASTLASDPKARRQVTEVVLHRTGD